MSAQAVQQHVLERDSVIHIVGDNNICPVLSWVFQHVRTVGKQRTVKLKEADRGAGNLEVSDYVRAKGDGVRRPISRSGASNRIRSIEDERVGTGIAP